MRMVAVVPFLLAAAIPARAAILAAGPGYASLDQTSVTCTLYNVGTTSVAIYSTQIIREGGVAVSVSSACPTSLAPGRRCSFGADNVANGLAHACKAVVSSKASIRGTFAIHTVSNTYPYQEPLR
jgi:hypothetical protein